MWSISCATWPSRTEPKRPPICREDWVANMEEMTTYACCCKKICKSCSDKIGSAPCPLCRAPPLEDAEELAHIRRHAKDEVPEAVKLLGDAYRIGQYGLVKSFKKAAKLYKRAVELGDVAAMNLLALHLFFGKAVESDPKKAIRLWRMAADRGHAEAQYRLHLSTISKSTPGKRDAYMDVRPPRASNMPKTTLGT